MDVLGRGTAMRMQISSEEVTALQDYLNTKIDTEIAAGRTPDPKRFGALTFSEMAAFGHKALPASMTMDQFVEASSHLLRCRASHPRSDMTAKPHA